MILCRGETMLSSHRCSVYTEWVTALLIGAAVVSVWRGAWVVLDALLLPEHPLWSAVASLFAGCVGMVTASAMQPCLASWARTHRERRALWIADALFTYAALWICVLFWRGVWAIWEHAFGHDPPVGSLNYARAATGCVSHGAGLVLLGVCGSLRNLSAAPMVISSDGALPIFGAGVTVGLRFLNPLTRA